MSWALRKDKPSLIMTWLRLPIQTSTLQRDSLKEGWPILSSDFPRLYWLSWVWATFVTTFFKLHLWTEVHLLHCEIEFIDLLHWIEVALLVNLSMGTATDVFFVARFPFKEGINDLYFFFINGHPHSQHINQCFKFWLSLFTDVLTVFK